MNLFNLSSAQKMLLCSELNNQNNDSFYLKFRKDYGMEDFNHINSAIKNISQNYLNLQIKHDENGDFKQYYSDVGDVNQNIIMMTFIIHMANRSNNSFTL